MQGYSFTFVDNKDSISNIEALLNQRNNEIGMQWNPNPITIVMSDSDGKTFGGLSGSTNFDWLHVKMLAVHQDVQGNGHGRVLMQMAEDEAVKRGCTFAHLDTFSFQALPFYQKLGYEIFGTLPDYPHGHTRYYLKKQL